jgi:hypothetical protein
LEKENQWKRIQKFGDHLLGGDGANLVGVIEWNGHCFWGRKWPKGLKRGMPWVKSRFE